MLRKLFFIYFVLAAVQAIFVDSKIVEEWTFFKKQYGKTYENVLEEESRFKAFKDNKYLIAEHNKLFSEGKVKFQIKMNKFSDMLSNEIMAFPHLDINQKYAIKNETKLYTFTTKSKRSIKESVDWAEKGFVSDVANQGACFSSWAFAAASAIESHLAIKNKNKPVRLSVQNLVDCAKRNKKRKNGCEGSWPITALQYVLKNKGIDTETSYRYYQKYNAQCLYNKANKGATIRNVISIPQNDWAEMMRIVSDMGPVAISLNTQDPAFHYYSSGVYDKKNCNEKPNHSALIVGYGAEDGTPYWLVKNSWGKDWGDEGYVKIARGHNVCGIEKYGVYPQI